jgi:hypothetical protein
MSERLNDATIARLASYADSLETRMALEIQERRAEDLTDDDMAALRRSREHMDDERTVSVMDDACAKLDLRANHDAARGLMDRVIRACGGVSK